MSKSEYWIWMQRSIGAGVSVSDIFRFYGTPENLYAAGKKSWIESGLFSNKVIHNLSSYSPSQSSEIIDICRKNGWSIVTCDDRLYPKSLKNLKDYPLVLYVEGDAEMLSTPFSIGIVGTRDATNYGKDVAEGMASALASAGAVIISGGALGVDSSAHIGALNAGGKTVAFLGSGLGCDYLKTNEELRRRIASNGAVVSEFLPFSEPTRATFPIRNRLISGFSQGLLVIEAGSGSGSLITARCAIEQGKDVFAVPGNILSYDNLGTNNLIRDGVKPIFSPMDILGGFIDRYGKYINLENMHKLPLKNNNEKQRHKEKKQKQEANLQQPVQENEPAGDVVCAIPSYATDDAKKLFDAMTQTPKTADEYVIPTGIPVSRILSALTELEMYGLVQNHTGKRYSKNIQQDGCYV